MLCYVLFVSAITHLPIMKVGGLAIIFMKTTITEHDHVHSYACSCVKYMYLPNFVQNFRLLHCLVLSQLQSLHTVNFLALSIS